jgi:hypothetical protein
MMIDFERVVLVEPRRPPLTQLEPNKRKRKSEEGESKNAAMVSCSIRRASRGFSEDIANAMMVFRDLGTPCIIEK